LFAHVPAAMLKVRDPVGSPEGVCIINAGEKMIRTAVLWVAFTAAPAVSLLLWLLVEPTALDEALAGEMEGMASDGAVGYYLALSAVLPLGLAVMTLLLDNRVTRYTNLIAGLLLGAWGLVDLVSHLAGGGSTPRC
jgi:hypothetical protein